MKILVAIIGLAVSFTAAAFDYRQMSLDEMTKESDLVVVAQFQKISEVGAKMRVVKVLKGDISLSNVQLVLNTGFPEADPECCHGGSTYLLFLKSTPRGAWVSSNGRFGVIEIQ